MSTDYRKNRQFLFANRLTGFNLWRIIDENEQGNLSFENFSYLLNAMEIRNIASNQNWEPLETINKFTSINEYNNEIKFDKDLNFEENLSMVRINENSLPSLKIFEYLFVEYCSLI